MGSSSAEGRALKIPYDINYSFLSKVRQLFLAYEKGKMPDFPAFSEKSGEGFRLLLAGLALTRYNEPRTSMPDGKREGSSCA